VVRHLQQIARERSARNARKARQGISGMHLTTSPFLARASCPARYSRHPLRLTYSDQDQ
jgi:hypothetical protein